MEVLSDEDKLIKTVISQLKLQLKLNKNAKIMCGQKCANMLTGISILR